MFEDNFKIVRWDQQEVNRSQETLQTLMKDAMS